MLGYYADTVSNSKSLNISWNTISHKTSENSFETTIKVLLEAISEYLEIKLSVDL